MKTRCLPYLYPTIRQTDNNNTDRFQRASSNGWGFQAPNYSQAGFLAYGLLARTYLPDLPIDTHSTVVCYRFLFPNTAVAGMRWTLTIFPFNGISIPHLCTFFPTGWTMPMSIVLH